MLFLLFGSQPWEKGSTPNESHISTQLSASANTKHLLIFGRRSTMCTRVPLEVQLPLLCTYKYAIKDLGKINPWRPKRDSRRTMAWRQTPSIMAYSRNYHMYRG